jgi:hypothetical protein
VFSVSALRRRATRQNRRVDYSRKPNVTVGDYTLTGPAGSCPNWIGLLSRLRLKCDGTCAETRFRLSAKRTSPFKSAGSSVQSTAGSGGVRVSVSNAGYTMFRGSVKSIDYPFHSPVSPSLPLQCVTVCHHISTGLYHSDWHFGSVSLLQSPAARQPCCTGRGSYSKSSTVTSKFFQPTLVNIIYNSQYGPKPIDAQLLLQQIQ